MDNSLYQLFKCSNLIGTKTRTLCRFGKVFLMVKKAGDTTFKKVKLDDIRNDLGIAEETDVGSDSDSSDDEENDDKDEDYTSPLRKGLNKRRRKTK